MTSFGLVKLRRVWKMLDHCAEGYQVKEQAHLWRVTYKDRVFPALQLGKRSSTTPEIELGNVKKMVRHLRIDQDCASKYLPQLR